MDARYAEDALNTLLHYVRGRPNCLDNGLGIVLARGSDHSSGDVNTVSEAFWPWALCATVTMDSPIGVRGAGLKHAANIHAETAIGTAVKLSGKLRKVTSMLTSEVRRTPWLLPLRNFNSPHLRGMLRAMSSALVATNDFDGCVRDAHDRFIRNHSVRRDGKGWVFKDDSSVEFKTPPRDQFHGARRDVAEEGGHRSSCFFTARLRMGGYYPDGFHYDCRRGSRLSGNLPNCHDDIEAYKGNPHLNIFPNDYIR
jgi:hypothetical protein